MIRSLLTFSTIILLACSNSDEPHRVNVRLTGTISLTIDHPMAQAKSWQQTYCFVQFPTLSGGITTYYHDFSGTWKDGIFNLYLGNMQKGTYRLDAKGPDNEYASLTFFPTGSHDIIASWHDTVTKPGSITITDFDQTNMTISGYFETEATTYSTPAKVHYFKGSFEKLHYDPS